MTVLAALGLTTSPAFAAPYGTTVLAETPTPQVYYELDEPVGATSAANSGTELNADGAYLNNVRNGREAAVACERRMPWGGFVSLACQNAPRGDAAGFSAYFAGAPYHAQVVAPEVDESSSYTLEAWVMPTVGGIDGGIVDHGDNGVLLLEAGAARFVAHARDGNADVLAPGQLSLDTWHHVAASWNNATGTARLYVDGVQVGTDTAQPTLVGATNGSPALAIGWTNQDGAAGLFRGYIDNVAKYADAIDVTSHYALGLAGGSGEVLSLTPENGSAFSANSTKGAQTRLTFTCSVPCSYDVTGPSSGLIASGGPALSVDVPLPLGDGNGTYTIDVTGGGYTATSSYVRGNFSTVILNDAPSAWWRFDEPDGIGIAADSAPGAMHPGSYQNPSANGGIGISGDASAARLFQAGDSGYVGISGVDAHTEGYTIELWFRTAAGDTQDMALFDHGAHGGGAALYVVGNEIRYRAVDGSVVSGPFVRNAWTHVAATWDGVTARLYVEGLPAGTPVPVSLSPSGSPALYLGFANVGLEKPAFRGLMDEVSYYGKALSADRVLNHFLADPPPAPAPAHSSTPNAQAQTVAAAPGRAATARAKAKARAKARAKAKAKALAKARARAKAKARAKKARARAQRRA